jgi:hypothetical protein
MSEPKRNWLTAEEFLAECAQWRAKAIVRRQIPKAASPPNPAKVYQLNPNLQYRRRSKLDSSDYPGEVVYRAGTTEGGGPEAERGGAAPAPAPGLIKGHISSPSPSTVDSSPEVEP